MHEVISLSELFRLIEPLVNITKIFQNYYIVYFFLLGITCAAVDIANSSKDPDENVYDFDTEVTYSCDAGFEHISGELSRKCEAIDKWTGTAPTCGSKFYMYSNFPLFLLTLHAG